MGRDNDGKLHYREACLAESRKLQKVRHRNIARLSKANNGVDMVRKIRKIARRILLDGEGREDPLEKTTMST